MNKHQEIQTFLAKLSKAEATYLLSELLTKNGIKASSAQKLAPADLSRVEKELLNDLEKAANPKSRTARWRLYFIFLLLRYGALRMEEIFQLRGEDLTAAKIRIRSSKFPREVPLAPKTVAQMRVQIEKWPFILALEYPLRCNGSLVRRAFSQYALKCGLAPHLLNARAIRRYRALELEYTGLPHELIRLFLGQRIGNSNFDLQEGQKILTQAIENEQFPKTSARNAFYGELVSLVKRGILVECVLETIAGLKVYAIITESSRQNLDLHLGMAVRGIIKAPMLSVFSSSSAAEPLPPNHFLGQIKEIKEDAEAMEINIILPQGNLLCALYVNGQKPDFPLATADIIGVKFSPFSVILTSA